jgi:5-methylcytosine-specific restriction endonuclease McrA
MIDKDIYDIIPWWRLLPKRAPKQQSVWRNAKGRERYLLYLKSFKWHKLRRKIIKSRGALCQDCGSKKDLQLHHLNYERLGAERGTDLRLLCKDCHEKTRGRKF